MKGSLDVVCLGIFVADALGRPVRRIPDWRRLELLDQVELQTGGCPGNTGVGLARLGFNVGCVGKVGDDGFGDFILKKLASESIDTSGMKRDGSVGTSFTFVMIAPDGERAFFHYIGANGAFTYDDVDFGLIERSKVLYVGGSLVMPGIDGEPTGRILKKSKEMGVVTCLDTVYNGDTDALATVKPALPYMDYFFPSIDEARLMTSQQTPHDIAGFLLDFGVGTVALKMGAEGSYVRSADFEMHIPAFRSNVIDTTGAGDSWVAGFLGGVVKGWDLERCARLGSAMGAFCVRAVGTTAGLVGWDETVAFMDTAEELVV